MIRSRGISGHLFGLGRLDRPDSWYPYVFSSPAGAASAGFCTLNDAAQLEKGAGRQEPISFSEPGQARPADHYGKNDLEDDAKERESGSLSDLPFAARVLHAPQLGCA